MGLCLYMIVLNIQPFKARISGPKYVEIRTKIIRKTTSMRRTQLLKFLSYGDGGGLISMTSLLKGPLFFLILETRAKKGPDKRAYIAAQRQATAAPAVHKILFF